MAEFNERKEELEAPFSAKDRIEFSIAQKINHPGEVNKARYMPQNPNIIATMCIDGNALVFDRTKHPSQPKTNTVDAQIELKGHEKEGFGLDWNRHTEGQLATGSEDKTVKIWYLKDARPSSQHTLTSHYRDIRDFQRKDKVLPATRTFTHHKATVNDVQWHPMHGKNLLGTVSDDGTWKLMDLRTASNSKHALKVQAHEEAVNTLAFNLKHDVLFATGSADKTIGLFDMRFLEKGKLLCMEGHADSVTKIEWSPHDPSILASSSDDRRTIIWDITLAGAEQTPEDAEDGAPEM